VPTLSLKGRALQHLARREHSRNELERKLLAHLESQARAAQRARPEGNDEQRGPALGSDRRTSPPTDEPDATDQVRRVLDELAARGLLSDERAAESLLASHARRFGSRRLKQTLQAKGLAPELVRSTVQQSRATEYERARELWRRRFGQPPADAKEQARQMRFLAGRGFDADIIRRVVKSSPQDDTDG
jgi:regulatory protein